VNQHPEPDCGVYEVGQKVPDSCCTSSIPDKLDMIPALKPDPNASSNCTANFSFHSDGAGLRSFFGCVGDDITYAEYCRDPNVDGYPFPPGTDPASVILGPVPTPYECGCTNFIGQAPGCYKATDASSHGHNAYRDDPRHFYVHLEPCKAAPLAHGNGTILDSTLGSIVGGVVGAAVGMAVGSSIR